MDKGHKYMIQKYTDTSFFKYIVMAQVWQYKYFKYVILNMIKLVYFVISNNKN